MSDELKSQPTFSVAELLAKESLVLETLGNIDDAEEEEDGIFGFSRHCNFSNQEMLEYLNIVDNEEEASDNLENDIDSIKIVPCGNSFEKLKQTMTDITGDGKVFKITKQAGVGAVVPEDAMVSVHYMGYFEFQDEPFDSSYLRQSAHRVRLNAGSLILGLELGIGSMKKHEIAHFIIHPDYAFGAMGCPPRVRPNEEVMFSVHLIDFIDNAAADTYENLDHEERKSLPKVLPKALAFHATANDDFKRNRTRQAIKGYNTVVRILNNVALDDDEEQEKQQRALSKALVNLGVCYNKVKDPRKACLVCQRVPLPNAKSHFTHGKALMMLGAYDAAMKELHAARLLEPNNIGIVKEIKELNDKIIKYRNEEKELWKRSLNVRKNKQELSEYAKVAKEICQKLLSNPHTMRLPLPFGLQDNELDCFKEQAALLGLTFTKHERMGKERQSMIDTQAETYDGKLGAGVLKETGKRALIIMPEDADISEVDQMADILGKSGINVIVASLDDSNLVRSSSNILRKVDAKLSDILREPPFDVLILPGGLLGTKLLGQSKTVRALLEEYERKRRWIVAIGDAPLVLRKHFIGAGKILTCHPLMKDRIAGSEYLKYRYIDDDVFVDGKIITCKGGLHTTQCALNLVHLICGRSVAEKVANTLSIVYDDGYCRDCCGNCKYCCREDKKEIEPDIADRYAYSTCCSADDDDVAKWESEKVMSDILEREKSISYKLRREEIKDLERDRLAEEEDMKKFIEEDSEEIAEYKRKWEMKYCNAEAQSLHYKREYVEREEARYDEIMQKKYDRQNKRHEKSKRRQEMFDNHKDLTPAKIDSMIAEFNHQENLRT